MTYFNSLHFGNIDSFCSGINLETDRPTVDLSSVSFIEPYALIYLGLFLRLYNSKGKFFNLILPKDSRVREYLSRMNFYQRFNFGKYPIGKENLWRFNTNTSMNDIVDIEKDNSAPEYVVSCLEDLLSKQYHINQVRFDIGSICEIVAEIIDNFVQHSGELLAVMTFQYYPKNQVLVVAIGDCGIGIKKAFPHIQTIITSQNGQMKILSKKRLNRESHVEERVGWD